MEKIISQIVEIVKSEYAKELLDKDDLKKVEKVFKKVSDEITAKSLKKYLEEYDEELRLDDNRNKNYVVQRTVSKNITSVLGTFRLNRTRYYDKENDCYFCLLDRKLNIPEYEHRFSGTWNSLTSMSYTACARFWERRKLYAG